ncbi:MAG: DUF362 domain-containing protein [Bacteroidales bacterium]|nr:DUF362 domain-containing protein [Bacteroidales bacterium]
MPPKLIFFALGALATIWFLVRVIPKPSRAAYPCMQATAPFMSGFVLYLISLGGVVKAFKHSRSLFAGSKYALAFLFLIIAGFLWFISNTSLPVISRAGNIKSGAGYFTPNDPMGVAKGIFPGRVVWIWNPDATNENCTNSSNFNGVMDPGDDAWFMAKNNDQAAIDSMVIKSVMALTGASGNAGAWELLFKYYNSSHGNGNIGYTAGQKIFIKINCTSANGGLAGGRYYANLSRNDQSWNSFTAETNPFIVLSMLRQLVTVAQVPENMIFVGDPARNIFKEFYDIWHGEFPDVNYLGNNLITPELNIVSIGRTPVAVTSASKVFFSDHGTVMPDAITDKLFTIFEDMDYLINIPTMKAHATAGITLAAKNHFGSFTRQWAMHLHAGLMDGADDPQRPGYGLYRVQTDIMMHNLLSGKNLLIVVDALYPGEDALEVPYKWTSIPFNNDWCSSIFMSLDPVAVESVCHDFLRTEYNGPTIAESRPNWFGVDDYLHQAADSSNWSDNIIYDPDNDGILITSLGVHEHWNDSLHKQYTRNLGTGDGIELVKLHEQGTGMGDKTEHPEIRIFPNPTCNRINISAPGKLLTGYSLTGLNGKVMLCESIQRNSVPHISLVNLDNGIYILQLKTTGKDYNFRIIKQ